MTYWQFDSLMFMLSLIAALVAKDKYVKVGFTVLSVWWFVCQLINSYLNK